MSGWGRFLELMRRPALPGGKPIFIAAIAALMLLSAFVGHLFGRDSIPGEVPVTIIREVASKEMERELGELRLENEGLLARLRGRVEIAPAEELILDEPIEGCPETAIMEIRIRPYGMASYTRLTRLESDSISVVPMYQFSLLKDVDISRCTQFYFSGETFVCDTPRLGVLDLFLYTSLVTDQRVLDAGVGLNWRRWPSSNWSLELSRDINGWFSFGIKRKFRLLGR